MPSEELQRATRGTLVGFRVLNNLPVGLDYVHVTSCDQVLVLFPMFRSLDRKKIRLQDFRRGCNSLSLDTRAIPINPLQQNRTKHKETGLAWQLVFPGSCVTSQDARSVRHGDGQALALGNSSRNGSESEEMFWTEP